MLLLVVSDSNSYKKLVILIYRKVYFRSTVKYALLNAMKLSSLEEELLFCALRLVTYILDGLNLILNFSIFKD